METVSPSWSTHPSSTSVRVITRVGGFILFCRVNGSQKDRLFGRQLLSDGDIIAADDVAGLTSPGVWTISAEDSSSEAGDASVPSHWQLVGEWSFARSCHRTVRSFRPALPDRPVVAVRDLIRREWGADRDPLQGPQLID